MKILEQLINQIPPEECRSMLIGVIQAEPAKLRDGMAQLLLDRAIASNCGPTALSAVDLPAIEMLNPETDAELTQKGDFVFTKSQRAYLAAYRHSNEIAGVCAVSTAQRRTYKIKRRLAAEAGCSFGLIDIAVRILERFEKEPLLKAKWEPAILALENPLGLCDVDAALRFEGVKFPAIRQ